MYKDFIISFSESTKYISHGRLRDDLSQSNGWPIHLIIGLWACRSTTFNIISSCTKDFLCKVPLHQRYLKSHFCTDTFEVRSILLHQIRSFCNRDTWSKAFLYRWYLMSGPPAPNIFSFKSSCTGNILCNFLRTRDTVLCIPLFDVKSFCTKYILCQVFLQQWYLMSGSPAKNIWCQVLLHSDIWVRNSCTSYKSKNLMSSPPSPRWFFMSDPLASEILDWSSCKEIFNVRSYCKGIFDVRYSCNDISDVSPPSKTGPPAQESCTISIWCHVILQRRL